MIQELIDYLEVHVDKVVGKLDQDQKSDNAPKIEALLKAAMSNERETSLLSCRWALDEVDNDFAIKLIRLAGDEAKHYQLISEELLKRGESYIPGQDFSPLYRFLECQKDTFSRVITGPFAREYLATKRNQLFLKYCSGIKANSVIELYEIIQADEIYHFEMGRELASGLIRSVGELERAKTLVDELLAVVDDIQEMVMLNKGLSHLPGC